MPNNHWYIICFSKKLTVLSYDGFVGGTYSTTPPTSTGGYPYARLLNDRGGAFSKLQWFDRNARLIISQNTKQHNYKRQAYNYTLYDALGHIIEVGQKTENTDTVNTFNKIFGDTIMNFRNPNAISNAKYLAWIKDNTGPRTEVVHNYYDVQDILNFNILQQQETRNRIASSTYSDTLRTDSLMYNNATHYSYDVHGNITSVIQDDSITGIAGQRYKREDFNYDLVSFHLNEFDYQSEQVDQYYHKYSYDADNRITAVYTSKDSIIWDNDANYFYYAHGPLARLEIGDQQIQGTDYVYTLQGWTKGVNSDLLDSNRDMGHDGLQVAGNLNRCFARDAMGYTVKYFKGEVSIGMYGDYDAINKTVWNNIVSRFEAVDYNSDLMNSRHDLYDGNISAAVTNIQQPQTYSQAVSSQKPIALPQGTAYNYDQLNRLVDMKAYQNLDTNNVWGVGITYSGLYHNWLTYDANGNMLTQKRADQNGAVFDSLTYRYNNNNGTGPTIQNRLYHVNDVANVSTISNDIKDEGTFNPTQTTINQKNNYRYNAIGELAKDTLSLIDTIIWTADHKVWKVKKYNGDSVIFGYNSFHDKILEEYKPFGGIPINTYYVNNPQGQILAIYSKIAIGTSVSYELKEREIYGKSILGNDNTPVQLIASIPASQIDTFNRYIGLKKYALANQVGNVLAIVSDRKIPRPNNTSTLIDHYEADLLSSSDYYPFGMPEPGRNFDETSYRFGFNNKEKIDSLYGIANAYDYGKRMFDPRLGRFLSIDPMEDKYPFYSPYEISGCNPIRFTDLDGAETSDPQASTHSSPLSDVKVNAALNAVGDPQVQSLWQQAKEEYKKAFHGDVEAAYGVGAKVKIGPIHLGGAVNVAKAKVESSAAEIKGKIQGPGVEGTIGFGGYNAQGEVHAGEAEGSYNRANGELEGSVKAGGKSGTLERGGFSVDNSLDVGASIEVADGVKVGAYVNFGHLGKALGLTLQAAGKGIMGFFKSIANALTPDKGEKVNPCPSCGGGPGEVKEWDVKTK